MNSRWEYKNTSSLNRDFLTISLDNEGKLGWELVSVVYDGKEFVAFLKRKIQ